MPFVPLAAFSHSASLGNLKVNPDYFESQSQKSNAPYHEVPTTG